MIELAPYFITMFGREIAEKNYVDCTMMRGGKLIEDL